MPYGPEEQGVVGARLPVPEAEAEVLVARVDAMIDHLDQVITSRHAKREVDLEEWQAPNRVAWDEDFFYAQLDLQAAVDLLQAYRGQVTAVVEAIHDHNAALTPPGPPPGTTTTTTTPAPTPAPSPGPAPTPPSGQGAR